MRLAEHGQVVRARAGVVVAVLGVVRPDVGSPDAAGRGRVSVVAANRGSPGVVSIEPRTARFSESTVEVRLRAVMSFYDFHLLNGVALGRTSRLVHPWRQVPADAGTCGAAQRPSRGGGAGAPTGRAKCRRR